MGVQGSAVCSLALDGETQVGTMFGLRELHENAISCFILSDYGSIQLSFVF